MGIRVAQSGNMAHILTFATRSGGICAC